MNCHLEMIDKAVKKNLILLFVMLSAFSLGLAQNFPEPLSPARLVNDFENILGEQEKATLESKLQAYNDSTSSQITIVTIADLQGYAEGDYANRLFEKWKIGQKGKDNGVLILISKAERAGWIEVGYGLEAKVPDGVAKGIIDESMIPYFRQGKYYEGLDAGIDVIIQRASGEFTADENSKSKKKKSPSWIFILIVMVVIFIMSKLNGPNSGNMSSKGYRGGGLMGGGFMGGGGFGGGFGGGSSGGFGGFGGGGSGGGGAGGRW